MKPVWWTCTACGKKQISAKGFGTPVCTVCKRPAEFQIAPPKGQAAMDFGPGARGDEDPAR